MESLAGVEVDGQLRALRRLLYCGEWIESHTLHIFMLHAPDFLGVASAVELAKINPALVETALRLKKIGNEVMRVVGGREVHPINVRVGGLYKAPTRAQLDALVPDLQWAKEASLEAVRVVAGLDFPELEQDYELVALDADGEYPIDRGGRLVSNRGLDIPIAEFFDHVVEEHVEHSNALHARLRERGSYLVGPLARYALHRDLLSPDARAAADAAGLEPVVRNPFRSIVVRAVELVHACDEALRLIEGYEQPPEPALAVVPAAGVGHGASEAPRGRPLPPLPPGRHGHDPRREDRPADLAEPALDRGGPARVRLGATPSSPTRSCGSAASRRSATTTRASPARRTSSRCEIDRG